MSALLSGCITLTTDFGTRDPYVGIMKSCILRRFAAATVIDLTHEIAPFRPEEAGFWLGVSAPLFPAGSVHVAVVDPGVGTERALLLVRSQQQLFLAPDNGLLGFIMQSWPDAIALRIETQALRELGIEPRSATFHGRDILAPLAAELAAGRCKPESLGPVLVSIQPGKLAPASCNSAGVVTGSIATIDRYGNLLTTIDARMLESMRAPVVTFRNQRLEVLRTYGATAVGNALALINAFGRLEIAVASGSAVRSLGADWGEVVQVKDEAPLP